MKKFFLKRRIKSFRREDFMSNFLEALTLRIYLDNCCFGRPFDNQTFPRIFIETQATLFIQEKIRAGKIELATSHILHYENSQCQNEIRKESVSDFMKAYSK
ncbi:MAG: hypothetical protein IJQ82_01005, partial [Selenomonadaceae bacterium]|nr:hypothetical protein [Selenomonadaceae bacterium]